SHCHCSQFSGGCDNYHYRKQNKLLRRDPGRRYSPGRVHAPASRSYHHGVADQGYAWRWASRSVGHPDAAGAAGDAVVQSRGGIYGRACLYWSDRSRTRHRLLYPGLRSPLAPALASQLVELEGASVPVFLLVSNRPQDFTGPWTVHLDFVTDDLDTAVR